MTGNAGSQYTLGDEGQIWFVDDLPEEDRELYEQIDSGTIPPSDEDDEDE